VKADCLPLLLLLLITAEDLDDWLKVLKPEQAQLQKAIKESLQSGRKKLEAVSASKLSSVSTIHSTS